MDYLLKDIMLSAYSITNNNNLVVQSVGAYFHKTKVTQCTDN